MKTEELSDRALVRKVINNQWDEEALCELMSRLSVFRMIEDNRDDIIIKYYDGTEVFFYEKWSKSPRLWSNGEPKELEGKYDASSSALKALLGTE